MLTLFEKQNVLLLHISSPDLPADRQVEAVSFLKRDEQRENAPNKMIYDEK